VAAAGGFPTIADQTLFKIELALVEHAALIDGRANHNSNTPTSAGD